MTAPEDQAPSAQLTTVDAEAIEHLKEAIASGKHWYTALLEAIGRWNSVGETHDGRTYRYLVGGEAFDWLLLAERLCQSVDSLLPEDEKIAFLFHGEPPLNLSTEEFKRLIGEAKYRQYLNYFYGIVVEEALVLAVQEEVRKERWVAGYGGEKDAINEAYRRVYGATKTVLLKRFRKENGYPHIKSIALAELKEFTYWLFKYRLKESDKSRVASDTKKALLWLNHHGFARQLRRRRFQQEFNELVALASGDIS